MKNIGSIFIGLGSIFIIYGLFHILFNFEDKSVILSLPVILAGIALIAVYIFMFDKSDVLKQIKR